MSPPRQGLPSTAAAAAPRGRRVLAAGLLAAALAGCATVVTPPPAPVDPVEVFLLDHGRTPSLVLPAADGEAVRWAYGDWRWYALGEHGVGEALAALFRRTRAGLGREGLEVPPRASAVRAAVSVEIDSLYPIRVERHAATALAERLEGLFSSRAETRTVNPDSGLHFVHHPEPYTLLHNSNRVVADWLRELGCGVRGRAILSRWRLRPPPPRPPPAAPTSYDPPPEKRSTVVSPLAASTR